MTSSPEIVNSQLFYVQWLKGLQRVVYAGIGGTFRSCLYDGSDDEEVGAPPTGGPRAVQPSVDGTSFIVLTEYGDCERCVRNGPGSWSYSTLFTVNRVEEAVLETAGGGILWMGKETSGDATSLFYWNGATHTKLDSGVPRDNGTLRVIGDKLYLISIELYQWDWDEAVPSATNRQQLRTLSSDEDQGGYLAAQDELMYGTATGDRIYRLPRPFASASPVQIFNAGTTINACCVAQVDAL